MSFFNDARKALTDLAQDAANRISPAAAAAHEQLNRLGQEAGKRVVPAAQEALNRLNKLATGASDYVAKGYATDGQPDDVDKSDWSFVSEFGEEFSKKVGVATSDFWSAMTSGNVWTGSNQDEASDKEGGPKFTFREKDMPKFSDKLKQWIQNHPMEVAKLLACIAAAPTAVVVTPAVLALIGFTPLGVGAGSIAAGIQSSLGPVAAGSAFAILMSAGAGGMGLVVVQAIATTSLIAPTCGAAALAFLNAVKEDAEECHKENTKSDTKKDSKDGYCKWDQEESFRN